MRISKKAEYALRALVRIARGTEEQLHQIHELSEKENIPLKFLEQILLALRHGEVLASKRGVNGGYFFARPPADITVGEVIRLIDGPIAPVPCVANQPVERCTCPDPKTCALRLLMVEAREGIVQVLDQQSLEDMAKLGATSGLIDFEI